MITEFKWFMIHFLLCSILSVIKNYDEKDIEEIFLLTLPDCENTYGGL